MTRVQKPLDSQTEKETYIVFSSIDVQIHLGRMPGISLGSLPKELRGIDVPIHAGSGYELWCSLTKHIVPEPQALDSLKGTNKQLSKCRWVAPLRFYI